MRKIDMQQNISKAVICTLIATVSLSIMALFVKLAAPHTNNNVTIFFRFAVSFFYIALIMIIKKTRGLEFPYKTQHFWLHMLRAIMSVSTMLLFYYSLRYLSLVNGNLLVMTNALFVPIIGLLIFRQGTNIKHWAAVILGFIGILLVIKPGHELFHLASIIGLGAGLTGAIALITIRSISKYDHPYTSMFYYFPLAFIISGIISLFNWKTPDLNTLILLICVGIFGTIYQEFLIRASQYASSKLISSLMYSSIIFSGFLGFTFFGEIPGILSTIGIFVVCIGSLLTVYFAK